MRIAGVFNGDSGQLSDLDMAIFMARATELAEERGITLDCRSVAGDDLIDELTRAATDPAIDVLLAGGGDGTISAAAGICFMHGKPLAVLPAGTMNFFARTLRVPLDLEAALVAIFEGRLYDVDIATANDRPFIHQFSVGLHARLVELREQQKTYKNRLQKMFASLRAIFAAVSRRLKFEVEIVSSRGRARRLASGVSVSNNLLGEGHMPHADHVDAGVLGVYVAKPMTPMTAVRFCFGVLVGHWKDHPGLSEAEVTEVTLVFPRRKRSARAVIDGELVPLTQRVEVKIHPGGLRVLAPQALAEVLVRAQDVPDETGPALAG